jgi:hypothetical protein
MDENLDNGQSDQQAQGQQQEPQVNAAAIRKSTQASMLKALGNATGTEFQSMEDLISTVARLTQQVNQQAQQPQQSQQQTQAQPAGETAEQKQKRVTANDLQDQLQAMQQKFEETQRLARERELDISIRNSMGDKFDSAFSDYTMSQIKKSLFEQDGEWIVVDSKNRQRYTESGTPMTVQNLIDELGRANPKLLRQAPQPQGGSGLRPQGSMFDGVPGDGEFVPDYTKDPAAFEQWASRKGLGKSGGLKSIGVNVQNSSPNRMFGQ